jgi:hypothetical protein
MSGMKKDWDSTGAGEYSGKWLSKRAPHAGV